MDLTLKLVFTVASCGRGDHYDDDGHFDHFDYHYHSSYDQYYHYNDNFYDHFDDANVDLNDKRPPEEQKMQPHPSGFLRGRGPF